jgi:hypothetical protein
MERNIHEKLVEFDVLLFKGYESGVDCRPAMYRLPAELGVIRPVEKTNAARSRSGQAPVLPYMSAKAADHERRRFFMVNPDRIKADPGGSLSQGLHDSFDTVSGMVEDGFEHPNLITCQSGCPRR